MTATAKELTITPQQQSESSRSPSTWYDKAIYTLFTIALLEQVVLDVFTYKERLKEASNLQQEHAKSLMNDPDNISTDVKSGSMLAYFSSPDHFLYLMEQGFPHLFTKIYCGIFINQIKAFDVDGDPQTTGDARVAIDTTKHCTNLAGQVTILNPDKTPLATGNIVKNITLSNNNSDPSVLTIAEFDDARDLYVFVNTVQNIGSDTLEENGTLQLCHTPRSTGFKEMCEVVEIVEKKDGNYIIDTTVTGGDSGASVVKVTENKKEVVCTISRRHNVHVSDNLSVCSPIEQNLDFYAISKLLLATYNDPLYWEFNLYNN